MMSTARASRPSKDKSAKSSQAQNAKSDGQSVNMKNQVCFSMFCCFIVSKLFSKSCESMDPVFVLVEICKNLP